MYEMLRAIGAARHCLVVLSANTVNNPGWVKKEIRAVLDFARRQDGRPRLIALVLMPLNPPSSSLVWRGHGPIGDPCRRGSGSRTGRRRSLDTTRVVSLVLTPIGRQMARLQ